MTRVVTCIWIPLLVAVLLVSLALPLLQATPVKAQSYWCTKTVDSAGNVGDYNSLALDSSNYTHISYYDGRILRKEK